MFSENYESALADWHGRVDTTTDYDGFRWHQHVKPLNLRTDNPEPFTGKLGFAFIGFCSDQGVRRNKGRSGTAAAPEFLRNQMSNFPCSFLQEVALYDCGNIICEDIPLEEGQQYLAQAVERILSLNLFPIVLGGGHETTFGHYCGQLSHLKTLTDNPNLAIVNFDAHFDMRPYDAGSTSGSMFRQIANICENEDMPYRYMPLGIQQHSNTIQLFKYAKEKNVDYIMAGDVKPENYTSILERVDNFLFNARDAYITVCTDVFSSAFAPGVSATQTLGTDPAVVLPIIKHILRTRKVRGFDICEISPRFDQDNTTANLGAVIIFAVINTLCRLKGLDVTPE